MNKNSFKSSYFSIKSKINKKDYINIEKNEKKDINIKKQFLSQEDKCKVQELVNRDLLGSNCDKIDLRDNYYVGDQTTGFMILNDEQILYINLDKKFKRFTRSDLLEKEGTDDYILIKKMNKYTRFIKDEDEYFEYKQELKSKIFEEESKEEEEEVKLFNEIYIDLCKVHKDKNKIYYVNIELEDKKDKKFTVDSRAFKYCSKDDRWVIGDKLDDDSYDIYWKYGVMLLVGLLIIGLFVHFFA